jgi:hypothetical protein
VDVKAGKTRHWVGVHPYRNYQEREVEQMVEAYHTGVVFTQQDMERILNTNLKVMWDGDGETPKFRNSNATLPRPPGAAPRKDTAGTLWTPLADLSQPVRDLARRKHMTEIAGAYFENIVDAAPPSFARKYAAGIVSTADFPIHECAELNLAAALPAVVRAGEETLLVANLLVPAEIEITLGEKVLYRGKRSGLVILPWKADGAHRGEYSVRWTVSGGSYREFVLRVNR